MVLDCSVEREACVLNLAPTASTTAMLALGDALAVAVSLRKGFRAEDFAELHPGGKLGKQLAKVRDLMHAGEDVPAVALTTPMTDVIYEMSSKKLGMTTVQEDGRLRGVISDGDLRRLLEREGGAALARTAGEAMNPHPKTIAAQRVRRPRAGNAGGAQDHVAHRGRRRQPRGRRDPSARSVGRGVDLVACRREFVTSVAEKQPQHPSTALLAFAINFAQDDMLLNINAVRLSLRQATNLDRTALITGASSGFGLLTSVTLARRGWRVLATMRDLNRSDRLEAAAREAGVRERLEFHQLDVTSADQIAALASLVEKRQSAAARSGQQRRVCHGRLCGRRFGRGTPAISSMPTSSAPLPSRAHFCPSFAGRVSAMWSWSHRFRGGWPFPGLGSYVASKFAPRGLDRGAAL